MTKLNSLNVLSNLKLPYHTDVIPNPTGCFLSYNDENLLLQFNNKLYVPYITPIVSESPLLKSKTYFEDKSKDYEIETVVTDNTSKNQLDAYKDNFEFIFEDKKVIIKNIKKHLTFSDFETELLCIIYYILQNLKIKTIVLEKIVNNWTVTLIDFKNHIERSFPKEDVFITIYDQIIIKK